MEASCRRWRSIVLVLLISTYTQHQPRMRLMQRNRLFYSIRGDVAASYAYSDDILVYWMDVLRILKAH